ncbi:hypothetical protein PFICI_11933 [Pestalotiopsis fici W106-1]|uniref:Enoyl reductase (ER) domain-containing protein n=1 Tax=Pestalotiopsis fici (strain W106-1 / CGMCC3.15140) TaxID=1229662 RepID=W3WUK2_PESFW|nr:uncharacterized protein PFICI_11933 [Pestalotiopsis fici W106-1]ETS76546.1 hypothetical protein PFICI_11933 [Pestalotiopsis fici W106-1]
MRAVRYYGPQDIRLEVNLPEPECLPHQVKVRPHFCGLCGSDLNAYKSPRAIPLKDTPHPITNEKWPVTLGHEFSGEVVEIGSEVRGGLEPGDRVAVQPTICCGHCVPCRSGSTNLCDSFGFVGLTGWGGGLSDLVSVDARFVFKLPNSFPSDIGALVEPLAVAWHAIEQSGIKSGDNVLVMGAGPIGLAVIQCLQAFQPKQVIVVEVARNRKEVARRLGVTAIIDPNEEDVVTKARLLCDTQGPDVAFNCASVPSSIKAACEAVRKKGTIVNVAVWDSDIPINLNTLMFGEKKLFSALSYTTTDFENVIKLFENNGLPKVGEMITRKITMDRVVEDGILALIHETDKHVKILIDVTA